MTAAFYFSETCLHVPAVSISCVKRLFCREYASHLLFSIASPYAISLFLTLFLQTSYNTNTALFLCFFLCYAVYEEGFR